MKATCSNGHNFEYDEADVKSHFVMCADSTVKENVEKLMDGNKADMVFTDPPYGMDLNTDYKDIYKNAKAKSSNQDRVIGDDVPFDPTFMLGLANEVFLWGADYFCQHLPSGGSWIVWDKKIGDGKIGNEFELCWSIQRHKKTIIQNEWAGFRGMEAVDGNREHPTQKPVSLLSKIMDSYCREQKAVLDLFLGSGSTLIACEQTNRTCYGMELDPKYVDVIRKRYAKFVYPDRWEEEWESLTPEAV